MEKLDKILENVKNGVLSPDQAKQLIIDLFVIEKNRLDEKRCHNRYVLDGIEHCFVCTHEGCKDWH